MHLRIHINRPKLLTIIILSTEMNTFFSFTEYYNISTDKTLHIFVCNSTGNDLFSHISSIIYFIVKPL